MAWFICWTFLLIASPANTLYGDEPKEEEFDEGLFEDAQEDQQKEKAAPPLTDPAAPPPPPQRQITVSGTIRLNYYLYPTKEQMEITYKFEMGHSCNRPKPLEQPLQCVFNGNTPITTSIQGQLAKWKEGHCQLLVTIPDIPFGVIFTEQPDGSAIIKLPTFGPAPVEEWESRCSLANDPEFALNTIGAPEEWLNLGLVKAREAIDQRSVKVSETFDAETTFTARAEESNDEIGRAEVVVEGKIITRLVQPHSLAAQKP